MSNTIPATLQIVAESAMGSLKQIIGPILKGMSTDLQCLPGQKGATVSVGLSEETSNAEAFTGSYQAMLKDANVEELTLTLGEPLVAVSTLSETELERTSLNLFQERGVELAHSMKKKIMANIHNLITRANYPRESELDVVAHTVDNAAEAVKLADDYKFGKSRMWFMNGACKLALQKDDKYATMNKSEGDAKRSGIMGELFDLEVGSYADGQWDNGEGLHSYILDKSAILVATRVPVLPANSGVQSVTIQDEETGLTFLLRMHYEKDTRSVVIALELFVACAVGNELGLHRFTEEPFSFSSSSESSESSSSESSASSASSNSSSGSSNSSSSSSSGA